LSLREAKSIFPAQSRRTRFWTRDTSSKEFEELLGLGADGSDEHAEQGSPRWIEFASKLGHLNRPWLPWISGAAAFMLSFAGAMWLTEPVAAPQEVQVLASAIVSDAGGLMGAVQAAGLGWTSDIKGAIETLNRVDDGHVAANGWAFDVTRANPQLTIIVFAGGHYALTVPTIGPRDNVAPIFGLSDAKNASFEARFACKPGENLVFIAVTRHHTYSQFPARVCP
jgi:hypothetical protein